MIPHCIPSAAINLYWKDYIFMWKNVFPILKWNSVIFAKVNSSTKTLIGIFSQPGNTLKLKTYFSDAIK